MTFGVCSSKTLPLMLNRTAICFTLLGRMGRLLMVRCHPTDVHEWHQSLKHAIMQIVWVPQKRTCVMNCYGCCVAGGRCHLMAVPIWALSTSQYGCLHLGCIRFSVWLPPSKLFQLLSIAAIVAPSLACKDSTSPLGRFGTSTGMNWSLSNWQPSRLRLLLPQAKMWSAERTTVNEGIGIA